MFSFIHNETTNTFKQYNTTLLKNKKILITGASGLIGHYLISFFLHSLKSKNKIKLLTLYHKSRLPSYLGFLKKIKNVRIIKKDLSKYNLREKKKYDYIFHLAGYAQPLKFTKNPMQTFFLNTKSILNLKKNLNKRGKFIYLSSSEVYSGLTNKATEEKIGKANTDHPRASYIFGKLSGETILSILKKTQKINYKIIRLCLAYGPGTKKNDFRAINQFIEKSINKREIKLIDQGTDVRQYIYILDVIKMILNISFFGKSDIYNIGGKKKILIKNLAKQIAKIQNKILKFPKIKKIKNFGAPKNAMVSIKKYEDEFGKMKLTNFESGLKKTIIWQKYLYK